MPAPSATTMTQCLFSFNRCITYSKSPFLPWILYLNSGTRQTLTSLEAELASIAINPAYLPINLTIPTPYSAQ